MSTSFFDALGTELGDFLAPIVDAVEDPYWLAALLNALGSAPDNPAAAPFASTLQAIVGVVQDIEAIASTPSPSFADIGRLLESSRKASQAIQSLESSGQITAGLGAIGKDLTDLLIGIYIAGRFPVFYRIAVLLCLIDSPEDIVPTQSIVVGGKTVRKQVSLPRFHADRLLALLQDPTALLKAQYLNPLATDADANAMADKLFQRVRGVLTALNVLCKYGVTPEQRPLLRDGAPFVDHALTVWLAEKVLGADADAGLTFALSPATRGDLGLVITPFGALKFTDELGAWTVEVDLTADVEALAIGHRGTVVAASVQTTSVDGKLSATLASPDDGPAFMLGAPTGTRLEVGGAKLHTELAVKEGTCSWSMSADVLSSTLVLSSGDGDGFLQSILPADALRAKFDLGIAWSTEHGLTFRGTAGLDATLPVDISLDGFSIPAVHLALQASDAGVLAEVSTSIALSIGPFHALVDRIGINTAVTFPASGGNLGIADLSFGFKPPSGVGLEIDAPGVSGGGSLSFDPEKGQYAGVMQLNVEGGLTLTAIGLISTHLPNGAKGYSFVVLITAEGFEPIPLGLGFTLTGIGGLLAINRTCNEEFLREGIKSNTLNSLLFPTDPIRNAVQIFGTLNNAFPPRDGSYLFGPVVQICWGTPAVLTMDLGLFLELGNRERLIILGRISAIMPTEKQDLIRLQMNVLGIIDFDQHTISVDAVLYDSRLVGKFPITGSMAMRLNWGSAPLFALSVGGLHPAFKPPANFPTLERLAISFSNTDDFRLRAEAYIAITSNTYQYGARLELYARAGGFSIAGQLGYDVLIQFDPFGFVADFYASVQLKYHSDNLFAVKVEGELAGPKPLHIKGKATFEIFWCSFSVGFDHTLLQGDPPPLLAPVVVMVQLKAALGDARNWSGQLADGDRRMVTLRERPAPDQIALHPLGRLSVQQRVVPLELEIAKFGNAKPADAQLFKINGLSVNGQNTPFSPVTDFFAPAQFFELTDDEKLTAPSFEELTAGISTGSQGFLFTTNELDILEDDKIIYETVIVDRESNTTRPAPPVAISAEFLDRHLSLGAAARSEIRRTGTAKYRVTPGKNSLVKKGWMIASTTDGSAQAAPGVAAGEIASYAQSSQALRKLRQVNPAGAKSMMLLRVAA